MVIWTWNISQWSIIEEIKILFREKNKVAYLLQYKAMFLPYFIYVRNLLLISLGPYWLLVLAIVKRLVLWLDCLHSVWGVGGSIPSHGTHADNAKYTKLCSANILDWWCVSSPGGYMDKEGRWYMWWSDWLELGLNRPNPDTLNRNLYGRRFVATHICGVNSSH